MVTRAGSRRRSPRLRIITTDTTGWVSSAIGRFGAWPGRLVIDSSVTARSCTMP